MSSGCGPTPSGALPWRRIRPPASRLTGCQWCPRRGTQFRERVQVPQVKPAVLDRCGSVEMVGHDFSSSTWRRRGSAGRQPRGVGRPGAAWCRAMPWSGRGDALAADRAGDGHRAGLGQGVAGADAVGVDIAGAAGRANIAAAAAPAMVTTATFEMGFMPLSFCGCQLRPAMTPPSTSQMAPVTQLVAGDSRKVMTLAMSRVVPVRPTGWKPSKLCRVSSSLSFGTNRS
jgi:hypothetical protein